MTNNLYSQFKNILYFIVYTIYAGLMMFMNSRHHVSSRKVAYKIS